MPNDDQGPQNQQGGKAKSVLKRVFGGGEDQAPPGHEPNLSYQPATGAEKARRMRREKDNVAADKPKTREVHIRQSNGRKSVEVVKAYVTTEYRDMKTDKVRYSKTRVHVRRAGETPAQAKARARARKAA